jgi:(p)ppGpp synthase/HD superfamily hydrolase
VSSILFSAVETAARAHRGQYRKGTRTPYLLHPLAVAEILDRAGCKEETVVAGLLHDVVEDTGLELEDVRAGFGDQVAELVAGASEPDKGAVWEKRKGHTVEHLRTAPVDVVLISCADKLHNLLSMAEDLRVGGEAVWDRFNRPREKQRWYYTELSRVYRARLVHGLADGLRALADRYDEALCAVFGQ